MSQNNVKQRSTALQFLVIMISAISIILIVFFLIKINKIASQAQEPIEDSFKTTKTENIDQTMIPFEPIEENISYQVIDETQETEVEEEIIKPIYPFNDQFAHVLDAHWTHMPVMYYIMNEKECGSYETNKIKKGFNKIEEVTNGIVSFKQIKNSTSADIDIECTFIENCYNKVIDIEDFGDYYIKREYETICNHKKGLAGIRKFYQNKILKAHIEFFGLAGFSETKFKGMSGFYIGSCGHPTTEIHEILHTFNYGHVDDENSIMYYAEDGVGYTVQEEGQCVGSLKDIDKDIVQDLITKYRKQ